VAATLTAETELTYASFPIEKVEQTEDGNVMVWGKATDDSIDSDAQIVDPDFAAKAIDEWMDTGPNVRVQHQAQRDPAGVGVSVERDGSAHWVKSKIIEPVAKQLVLGGALRAYSVGIARPTIVRDNSARGGRITDGQIVEISLVDRPANKNCGIQLVKAAADGTPEWVGKVFGNGSAIFKDAEDDVTVTLPHDVQVTFTPLDLAKIVSRKHENGSGLLTKDVTTIHGGGVPAGSMPKDVTSVHGGSVPMESMPKGEDEHPSDCKCMGCMKTEGEPDAEKGRLSSDARNALPDSAFVFPETRSYPIHDKTHARNALARVSENGTPEEKAKVRAAVARRYPGIGARDKKKAAKKAAAVAQGALAEKKDKAMCTSCGAKQNTEHAFCTECGKAMMGAPEVSKNHDFACLGCGSDLDKGEKFCPSCGKPNPGYNMMADLKIPANKSERGRVADTETVVKAKKPKKGGKGKPFGGSQAPPFGKDKEGDGAADEKKPAEAKKAKKNKTADAPVTSIKAKKKGGFGHTASPGAGVTGAGASGIETVPAHREPDGMAVEEFERDAGLPSNHDATKGSHLNGPKSDAIPIDTSTPVNGRRKRKRAKDIPTGSTPAGAVAGEHAHPAPGHRSAAEDQVFERDMGKTFGSDPAVAASMRLKHLGVDAESGYVHDLVCPAYSWDQVEKAHPAGWAGLSADTWQRKALEAAASAPLAQAKAASQLGQAVFTIKSAAMNDLVDIKTDIYKAFRDANPGPGSFPSPGEISARQFHKPHITTGRAAYSREYGAPNNGPIPDHSAAASQFQRGPLHDGLASYSPAGYSEKGAPYPQETGVHANLDYSSVQKEQVAQAFRAMHDHFDRVFPGVCPMNGDVTSPPAHSLVPAQKADETAEVTKKVSPDGMSKKARSKMKKKLTKKVMSGKMPLDQARIRMGKKPKTSPEPLKPQKSAQPDTVKTLAVRGEAILTPKAFTAELRKAQKKSDKKIAVLTKMVTSLADQPDPGTQAFKGMAVNPLRTNKSARPEGVQDVAAVAERTQMAIMRELENTARNSTNSMEREAAWNQVLKMKGIVPAS
jgi:hypothetical protein